MSKHDNNSIEATSSDFYAMESVDEVTSKYPAKAINGSKYCLNVRAIPSLTSASPVIACLNKGDRVTVLGEDGDFYRIKYKNYPEAYVVKEHLTLLEKE